MKGERGVRGSKLLNLRAINRAVSALHLPSYLNVQQSLHFEPNSEQLQCN